MSKKELVATLMKYMSKSMAYLCIQGRRRPSFNNMCHLVHDGIPYHAWNDFKEWMDKNVV